MCLLFFKNGKIWIKKKKLLITHHSEKISVNMLIDFLFYISTFNPETCLLVVLSAADYGLTLS